MALFKYDKLLLRDLYGINSWRDIETEFKIILESPQCQKEPLKPHEHLRRSVEESSSKFLKNCA